MYKKISDYGIIGDLHSVALVGLDGSIDWLCLPHIDSPSVFGAILDDGKGGRFRVSPADKFSSTAQYIHDTNVLVTTFTTPSGTLRLTDFMPVTHREDEAEDHARHELYRLIEVTDGDIDVDVIFEPRFDYARADTAVRLTSYGAAASGNGVVLSLTSTHALNKGESAALGRWALKAGDCAWLRLKFGEREPVRPDPAMWSKLLDGTSAFWRGWLDKSENGRFVDLAGYRDMVNRSMLTLKLLHYAPAGTFAAAATTSLPEEIGGCRNWDYRYTWVRDSAFTLDALFNLGRLSEMQGYLRWLEKVITGSETGKLHIMYGLRGEADLAEEELTHLDGYMGSRPVRVGNGAARQNQLDIYGELMDSALKLSDYVGSIREDTWRFLSSICDYVSVHWTESDHGIWEVRGGPFEFVYSKVMCWVALDRGITIARRYGFQADTSTWRRVQDEIRQDVLEKGWNKDKGAFVQHYGTSELDASNLLIPIVGFLPYDDPRVVSNLEATVRELGRDGFLYRYKSDDGLPGGEGTFLLCTCWLITNLIGIGRSAEAAELLGKVAGASNHLGLFSEEYDFENSLALGNFPQAFTHIGYLNCVLAFCREKARGQLAGALVVRSPSSEVILNPGLPDELIPSTEIAARLKDSMNVLRGAFFDAANGRVAYERMVRSRGYESHVVLSRSLKEADPGELESLGDKLAFWINLYNVIVIHGVIELGIRDSIKEVRNFLGRVKYDINGMPFSPDDIEHGILRANARPPYRIFRRLSGADYRRAYSLEKLDPRVHFALVCASSSCPPIGVYTPENIDMELDVAGRTFINSGGAIIDRENMRISLSQVFRWYKNDFGKSRPERLGFIARYFYEPEDREFVLNNADRLKVGYQDYDWRLNRY